MYPSTPKPSSCVYGKTDPSYLGGAIPIAGAAGDQQSALFDRPALKQARQRTRMEPAAFTDEYGRKSRIFSQKMAL